LLVRHGRKARLASLDPRAVLWRYWRRAARSQLEGMPGDRYIIRLLEPSQTSRYKEAEWADKVRPDINSRGHTHFFRYAWQSCAALL